MENKTTDAEKFEIGKLSQIGPKLYLGSRRTTSDEKLLRAAGIDSLIQVFGPKLQSRTRWIADRYMIDIEDSPQTRLPLDEFSTLLGRLIADGKTVLVHCKGGISRSTSLVMGYLIKCGLSFNDAFDHVKKCRPIINPNQGFIDQLRCYESAKRE